MRTLLAVLLVSWLPAFPSISADGVLEIHQTCAVQTGCLAGDTPRFPVTIPQAGGTIA
jgi:hypothetical protein